MLIDTTDPRFSQDERVGYFLRDVAAADPETGAELYASYGRRMSGRGTRYMCTVPTGETYTAYLVNGTFQRPIRRKAFTVTAHSKEDAITQANKALKRFLSKGPRWSDEQYNWIFGGTQQ